MADSLTDLPAGIGLRPATSSDRGFLLAVYGSTRTEELAVVPWTEEQRLSFIASQFDAQDAYYRQNYPDCEFLVILDDGEQVGRLYLARIEDELRVIDIALLPDRRGRGLGSRVLEWVIDRAAGENRDVTLHVEPWNRAKRLYERLGFESVELRGVYEFMRRARRVQLKTAS